MIRLSTVVRRIEDGVLAAGRKVGAFGHAVSVEYKARDMARMADKVAQYRDQREVIERYAELRGERHVVR